MRLLPSLLLSLSSLPCLFLSFAACSSTKETVNSDGGDDGGPTTTGLSTTASGTTASSSVTSGTTGGGSTVTSASTVTSSSVASTTVTSTVTTGSDGGTVTVTSSTSTSTSTSTGTGTNASGAGGASTVDGTSTDAGSTGTTTGGLGSGNQMGSGTTMEQYETALVSRNDEPYVLITNGWGPGFDSHTISWNGTSFTVDAMMGSAGPSGQPASYPTVFCGRYSVQQVPECGLPAARDSLTSVKTGWRWAPNGNENGEYNAAYDIWVGSGNQLQGYLMVWLRDPPSYQPAGSPNAEHQGIEVANVPGTWNIWNGTVNTLPIINWVRAEGSDSYEIEFDVMDFVRDAEQRGFTIPGSQLNAVAVGFEIWEGPINGLQSLDFYVDVN